MVLQALRQMHTFDGVSDADLLALLPAAEELTLEADDILFAEGDPASGLYVLLEGELEINKLIGGRPVVLEQYQPGVFVGEISILTGLNHTATGRAVQHSRFLRFAPALFADLNTSPVARLLLITMVTRVRDTESVLQQNEKLSALGRLSAGLAHELNNPAAASLRAAKQLPEALSMLQSLLLNLSQLNLSAEQISAITGLLNTLVARGNHATPLNALEQSDLEEKLSQWLEDRGIDNAWELAPALAQGHTQVDDLDALAEIIPHDALDEALVWIDGMLTMRSILTTLEQSTVRISEMINAVTAYSALDESPLQLANLHHVLDNTLVIFGHALRNMTITRDYASNVPLVPLYMGDIEQVWANIIDNAVDATNGRGSVHIHTEVEGECAVVEITDNGVGIPPHILPRIFEPFFTTKNVGEGAGLGLDIAYRIVVNRHHGDIRVTSQPGDTRFRVYLPLKQA
jgi:signal transduction histidine kinase